MPLESTLAQTAEEALKLEAGGAIVMTVSILLVVSLTVFCLYRILRAGESEEDNLCCTLPEHRPVPPDTDTHDQDT